MQDVSNKTILSLLIVALVVMVVGTVISLNKMNIGKYSTLSGAATTGTGTASLNVEAGAGISITDATASFGSGYVTPGHTSATVYTNGTFNGSWTNTSTTAANQFIEVVNNGNVNVNLTVSSNETSAETWFCGAGTCQGSSVATLSVLVNDTETGSCADFNISGTMANETYQDILTASGKATVNVCEDLRSSGNNDDISFMFKTIIPEDATIGSRSTTLTFTAASTGTQT